jgi:hypothetical protein
VSYQRRTYAYRIGIVTAEEHPELLKGQVVEIMGEEGENYLVRIYLTGKSTKIEKKFILVN